MFQYLLVPVAIAFAATSTKPAYRWPLNNLTCGLEVETSKNDALTPKQDSCTITQTGSVILNNGGTMGSNGYVDFNEVQSYIDVPIKDCLEISSVGMMITLNPTATSGTLVHYKATSALSTEVSEFRVSFIGNEIQTSLYINGEALTGHSISVNVNSWSLYGFSFNLEQRKLYSFSKYSSSSRSQNGIGGKLGVPGILRFGCDQSATPSDKYEGRVACVLLYDKHINYDEQLTITNCKAEWINVPSPVPSCVTPPKPKQVWPLDMKNFGTEITDLKLPLNKPDYRFGSGPVQLNNTAMKFDGSKYSVLQIGGIDHNYLSDNHAFGMFLFADKDNNASVLRIWTPASDATESVLKIFNRTVVVELYDTSEQKCGELIITDVLNLSKWHTLAFQVDFPSDIIIFIDESKYTGTHTCGGPKSSISPYRLDIGYVDETIKAGFRGRMQCLVLIDDINNIETILNEACNSSASQEVFKLVPTERNLLAKMV